MSDSSAILLAGTLILLGRWAADEHVDARTIIMILILALSISILSDFNEQFGHAMAMLVLVSATLGSAPPILKKLGLMK